MIPVPSAPRVYVAAGATDRRKGVDGLSALVPETLKKVLWLAASAHRYGVLHPIHTTRLSATRMHLRGRRGDLVKVLWWDGQGFCLFAKRLNQGRFVWPLVKDGAITLTPAQLAMLLEGIDWRAPIRTDRPSAAA